jgi:hypothetical protein
VKAESEVIMHTPVTPPRALVVYESMFGNTEAVARAIADGLSEHLSTAIEEVVMAPTRVDDVDLLVLGAPTHAFGLSRRQTRMSAASQGARVPQSGLIGLREWLSVLVPPSRRIGAATFDTRIERPRVPGSAARAARRRIRRLGFVAATKAKSFYVTGTPGPLADGELERARAWGQQLGAEYAATRPAATAA